MDFIPIRVQVLLTLASYVRGWEPGEIRDIEVPEGTTVGSLLGMLGIPQSTQIVCLVNGSLKGETYEIRQCDEIKLFPRFEGG